MFPRTNYVLYDVWPPSLFQQYPGRSNQPWDLRFMAKAGANTVPLARRASPHRVEWRQVYRERILQDELEGIPGLLHNIEAYDAMWDTRILTGQVDTHGRATSAAIKVCDEHLRH